MNEKKRGGARVGAGRPKVEQKYKAISVTLPPGQVERLDAYAAAQGITRSTALAVILERVDWGFDGGQSEVTIWTIGHSNHSAEKFIGLLKQHGIQTLVDVRSRPASRFCPHFNKRALDASLPVQGIAYEHWPELGGLHEGAGHGDVYEQAVARLLERAAGTRIAICCSEGKPQDCHRESMIGRSIQQKGHRVMHILGDGQALPAEMA